MNGKAPGEISNAGLKILKFYFFFLFSFYKLQK